MPNGSRLRFAALIVILLSVVSQAGAQKRKEPLPPRFASWLEKDVVYIITDEERKAFLKLTSDETRDKFIEDFWAVRNPLRNPDKNPYREEHYNRLTYATDHFGRQSNTPGWKTDMGRAYILFGKPASQARFIQGGQLYPCELWFYSNTTGNPALPSFFSLLFYIPEDIGEYKFYRPYLDGPMKLVRGSNFNSNKDVYNFLANFGGDLAQASMTLIPGEPVDKQDYTITMSSDMLVSKIQNLANDSYNVQRLRQMRVLRETVNSIFLVDDQRPLALASIVLADPAGQYWLDYAVEIDSAELGEEQPDGKTLKIASSYRLTSESGELVVEDQQERGYEAFYAHDGTKRFRPFEIANRLPVAPGKYRLEVEVRRPQKAKVFRVRQTVLVGAPGAASINGPLLISSVEKPADAASATTPFQYYGVQFNPSLRHEFGQAFPLRVVYQLQLADASQGCEIEFVIAHEQDREARRSNAEAIPATQFRNGRLLSSKTVSLTGLPDGPYRLVMNLRRTGSKEVLASVNVGVRLGGEPEPSTLYFDPNTRKMGQPGVAAYIRALGALAQKDKTEAAAYLKVAVERDPANSFASSQLLQMYYSNRQFGEIASLYDHVGLAPFEKSVDSLARISLSFWNVGQQQRARDVLASARSAFPGDPLVAAVSKTVH